MHSKLVWRLFVALALALPGVIAAAAPPPAAATTVAWTQVTTIPTPRSNLAATTGHDGWIYTFGGFAAGGGDFPGYRADVEAYNPSTGVWRCSVGDTSAGCSSSSIAPMPDGGRYLFAAVTGNDGTLYVLGGQTYTADLATVQAYNPTTNTWTTKASMREERARLGAAVGLDGKIYVVGSYYGSNTLEVFDPAANSWTYKANMLEGRYDPVVVAGADGRIYVIGGARTGAAGEDTTVQIYDPVANSWSYGAPAPAGRYVAGARSADGGIYATSGSYSDTSVYMYSPGRDAWVTKPAFASPITGQVTVLGPDNRLYAIGGSTIADNSLAGLPNVYAYAPGSWLQLSAPSAAGANVPFAVTATARLGSGAVDTSYRGTLHFTGGGSGATLPADYTFTAGDNGMHTFTGVKLAAGGAQTVVATDTLDASISASAVVTVDGVAPTTSADGNGYAFGSWTRFAVTVALNANDNNGGSGVDKTYYILDGGGQQTYSAPLSVASEGPHTLLYWSADLAGNVETQHSVSIKIDKTAPVVTCASADGVWHDANVNLLCTTVESGSGLTVPSNASFNLTTSLPANQESSDVPTNSASVCDLAGNCAPAGPVSGNQIDLKPPSISATAATADGNAYVAGSWTQQDVTVTFACADGGSGVTSCSPAAAITTPGANQARSGAAVDALGHTATAIFADVNIDRTAPVTVADGGAYTPGGWTNGAVRVSLAASDAAPGAGVAASYYVIDNGSELMYTAAGIDIASEGAHTLEFWSVDNAGNVEARQQLQILIDQTNPQVNCPTADALWHATDVSYTCVASDARSGLRDTQDASFTLSTSVAVDTEIASATTDSHAVCDVAGNCVTAGPIGGNQIDKRAPQLSCDASDGRWHAADVSVGCAASDGGAGLQNAGDASFSLATHVSDDAETDDAATDSRVVCDAVGNCATAGPLRGFKIDKLAPAVVCAAADGAWHADNVALSCATSDGGSGLAYGADARFTLTTSVADGVETATAATGSRTICDGVGNCAAAGPVVNNKIDRADPSMAISAPLNGVVYPRTQPLQAAFSCADGGAGLANCVGSAANGASLDTAIAGPHSLTVSAVDGVGNTTAKSVTYTVEGDMYVNAIAYYRSTCDGLLNGCLTFGVQIKSVHDGVANAQVTVRINKPGGASETLTGTTNAFGSVGFDTRNIGPGTYTLTVLNVTADYYHYTPDDNVVTSRSAVLGSRF